MIDMEKLIDIIGDKTIEECFKDEEFLKLIGDEMLDRIAWHIKVHTFKKYHIETKQ